MLAHNINACSFMCSIGYVRADQYSKRCVITTTIRLINMLLSSSSQDTLGPAWTRERDLLYGPSVLHGT